MFFPLVRSDDYNLQPERQQQHQQLQQHQHLQQHQQQRKNIQFQTQESLINLGDHSKESNEDVNKTFLSIF